VDAPAAAVAAGDVATAAAGAQTLHAGGTAADAAVAAMLAACAAETVMTGLSGGGFATYWDPVVGAATTVDFFVAVPGIGLDRPVAPMEEIEVVFGTQRLEYWAGAATVAVHGVPAGLEEVHRRWGRLPWRDVVEPARLLAADGTSISVEQAYVLRDVSAAMLIGEEGRSAYARHGRLIEGGELLHHAGLGDTFGILQKEGAAAFYTGSVADDVVGLVAERGGRLTAADLAAYDVEVAPAREVDFAGHRVHARTDLLDLLGTLAHLPDDIGRCPPAQRMLAWVGALMGEDVRGHTTNVAVVGPAGDACVVTTSLGLGSGEWVEGMHLNSMLGEGELMLGAHPPGSRVDSMMCPLVAVDGAGLALAAGAAGGSRIRSALVQVLTGVLAEGLAPVDAVQRPRVNPVPGIVHAEPGVPEEELTAAAAAGLHVERWRSRAAYFGGVSLVGRGGPAADPRRGGATVTL
jgi:gamma-glutamyltranspeptidase/glutathione hydrolase